MREIFACSSGFCCYLLDALPDCCSDATQANSLALALNLYQPHFIHTFCTQLVVCSIPTQTHTYTRAHTHATHTPHPRASRRTNIDALSATMHTYTPANTNAHTHTHTVFTFDFNTYTCVCIYAVIIIYLYSLVCVFVRLYLAHLTNPPLYPLYSYTLTHTHTDIQCSSVY